MRQAACLPALLLVAGIVAAAAPRLGSRSLAWPARMPWLAKAGAQMVRFGTVVAAGLCAVALALSLVGVNGGAVGWSPMVQVVLTVSVAIAVLSIRGVRGPRAEGR